jgi:hypothetical protein
MHRKLRKLNQKMHSLHFSARWVIGILLMVGGVLGFLPILGFWMVPLGLLVLAPDFKWARRGYLSIMKWLRRFRDRHKPKK